MPGPRGFKGSRGFDGKLDSTLFSDISICIFSVWIRSVVVGITGKHPKFLPLRTLLVARDLI